MLGVTISIVPVGLKDNRLITAGSIKVKLAPVSTKARITRSSGIGRFLSSSVALRASLIDTTAFTRGPAESTGNVKWGIAMDSAEVARPVA